MKHGADRAAEASAQFERPQRSTARRTTAGIAFGSARFAFASVACLCALSWLPGDTALASLPRQQAKKVAVERTSYRIDLKLDFDGRSYAGVERVHFVNNDGGSTSLLYFHLYPNLRPAAASTRDKTASVEQVEPDEPRLDVIAVRAGPGGPSLQFAFEDNGATLRVLLRESVPAGGASDIEIEFKGLVPEINADQTSLPAHVVQQVGAAMRSTPETRRPRDTHFVSRGVMLLGNFYPVLAARIKDEWKRKVELTIGDTLFADVADYEVSITTKDDVAIYTSGSPVENTAGKTKHVFRGDNLRGFAIVAGRSLRSAESKVAGVTVRSVFSTDHERIGRRVLAVAAGAVRVFHDRFGPLPVKAVTVAEAPLIAGFGSTEFPGLAVIASAFYVDFDSPQMRDLPEIVREQRASVEDSLEFAVAQGVAHEWWGSAVGSDPERIPVLDEGLAHWSALLYYQEALGPERALEAENEQLRGVYQIYRTLGGEDMPAAAPAREFRNSFQYEAIVVGKGALMFSTLRRLLGEDRFFKSLKLYYEMNKLKIAGLDELRDEFFAALEVHQRRILARTLTRWLYEKHGDEDVAQPDPQLAAVLGTVTDSRDVRDRNAFSRLGRFFWRQMTRIR